jgi:N-acyl-phosphatidylethanolamine-hydrolysing phospholipase D
MPAHHTDNGFRNLYQDAMKGSLFTYVRMRFFGNEEWADYEATADRVPTVATPIEQVMNPPADKPQITWIGHATVLVQYHGINILTDPMFSERASPISFLGPKRATPPSLNVEQLPHIDLVLTSHNHYDHLDKATVQAIGNQAVWAVPLAYKQWFANLGVTNVMEFDWWDEKNIAGARVTATPTQHWTGRGLGDRYKQLWAGWAVQIDGFKFWFGGDTGYNEKIFTEVGRRLGPFDLGLIPVGGYAPRWFMQAMHLNPEEAVQVHRDIRANFSLGIHWGAFPLTAEPIDEPPERLAQAARALNGSRFITVPVGKTLTLAVDSAAAAP